MVNYDYNSSYNLTISNEQVPALPGCITVNLGDALMRWSGDALKSNYHRVRMPLPGEHQV